MKEINELQKVTVFYCANGFPEASKADYIDGFEVKFITLPCSGMIKDVYLLKAFEAGSDVVMVLACPEDECRFVEGNLRAKKRLTHAKELLDELGLDGRRLMMLHRPAAGAISLNDFLREKLAGLAEIGPSPIRKAS